MDDGVKETFKRSNEYQLIDSAEQWVLTQKNLQSAILNGAFFSFLNRIDTIRQADYIPDTQDILFCRVETKSISKIEFEVPLSKLEGGKAVFWMYDVGGQRGNSQLI